MSRHAVFTIVQDDPFNLKVWAMYYRQWYSAQDTYVLHHPLPDEHSNEPWFRDVAVDVDDARHESFEERGFTTVPVYRDESFDHTWLRETVQSFQRFLFQSYRTVLFTEVDEIVVPVDGELRPYGLHDYLARFDESAYAEVCCTGYEVVHDYATEPPLDDVDPPFLKQRTFWYRATQYDKTLLAKYPLTWTDGFHALARPPIPAGHNWQREPDPGLLLLHLHKLDFEAALLRHRRAASRAWPQADLRRNKGFQNRIVDEDKLRDWWLNTADHVGVRARWERMPEAIKEVV